MSSHTIDAARPPAFQVSVDPQCMERNKVLTFAQHTIWLPDFTTRLYRDFPALTTAEIDKWLNAVRTHMFRGPRILFVNSSMPFDISALDAEDFNNLVQLVCASGSLDVLEALVVCFGERL